MQYSTHPEPTSTTCPDPNHKTCNLPIHYPRKPLPLPPTQNPTTTPLRPSSGRFVQRLRQEAARCPGVTVRQATVRSLLTPEGDPWQDGQTVDGVSYKLAATGQIHQAHAHLTVVCDGMYSSLRAHLTEPEIEHPSYFVGIVLKDVKLPFPNHGHVVLGNPSPILLYPIGPGEVRVLVDVPGQKMP